MVLRLTREIYVDVLGKWNVHAVHTLSMYITGALV